MREKPKSFALKTYLQAFAVAAILLVDVVVVDVVVGSMTVADENS